MYQCVAIMCLFLCTQDSIAQCTTLDSYSYSEVDNMDGTCTYEFTMIYSSTSNFTSIQLAIFCGPDELETMCAGKLPSGGGTFTMGPYTIPHCANFSVVWQSYAAAKCNGSTCTAGSILPLVLNSFSASESRENVILDWSTSDEKNSQYFEVQSSFDGSQFETIAMVDAKGEESNSYSLKDSRELRGLIYYRLKSVDFNGAYSFSSFVTIALERGEASFFEVYPNPVDTDVYVRASGEGRVLLFNQSGQLVKEFLKTTETLSISLSEVPEGIYVIKAFFQGEEYSKRVVKK